jgi:hypothetical protein
MNQNLCDYLIKILFFEDLLSQGHKVREVILDRLQALIRRNQNSFLDIRLQESILLLILLQKSQSSLTNLVSQEVHYEVETFSKTLESENVETVSAFVIGDERVSTFQEQVKDNVLIVIVTKSKMDVSE